MKKIFFIATFVFTFVLTLCLLTSASSVLDDNGNEYFPTAENVFYLPSCISSNEVTICNNDEKKTVNLSQAKTVDANENEVYVYTIYEEKYTFYFANSLPSIYIKTSIGLEYILGNQRQKDKNTLLCITNKDGTVEYKNSEKAYCDFNVRGNTTADYKKQPFQFKLNSKHNLFGMGEAKSWVLLANYLDQSNIRNSVMYKIGELLGLDTCAFKSVDLYINGEYYGLYLLCEKVQIQPNRVKIYELEKDNEILNEANGGYTRKLTTGKLINETIITEYQFVKDIINPSNISGGYLIELDNNYYKKEKCYFKTENGNAYVIKSPENASQEQVEYIARVFAEMEEAIYSPTGKNSRGLHYTQYVEIETLVYAYIMAELGRNWDAGSSSMYFYKDMDYDGNFTKIVKGPLWDCDNTLGNMLKNGANNTEGYWAKDRGIWNALTQHDYFNYEVAKTFNDIYPRIIEMTEQGGFISQQVSEISSSIVMERARWNSDDYSKWPMYGDHVFPNVHYDTWQSAQTFQFINGKYSDGIDNNDSTVIGYLKTHLINRVSWLKNTAWVYDINTQTPNISSDGVIDTSLTMPVAPTFDTVLPPNDEISSLDEENKGGGIMQMLMIPAIVLGAIAVAVVAVIIIKKR